MKKNIDNEIICITRPHWITMIIPTFISVIFTISAIMELFNSDFEVSFRIFFLIFSVLIFLIPYLFNKINVIKLTEREIVGRTGIIRVKKLHAPISKIQTVNVEKGLFGRIFGYSDLRIHCITGIYEFKKVANAEEIENAILYLTK